MEITSDTKPSDSKSTLPAENVDEPESESSPEATQSSDIGQENITPGKSECKPWHTGWQGITQRHCCFGYTKLLFWF